ncbi:hypothetical protein E1301_Tti009149 [Triplophysa tibetana]|uniref:C2H2-type domain-containing protein n=1 Tax=Triplophysa tibetana TaxID=1572043 RepID=A0A5A9PJY0_9TELE|nr:hypothetical protein E1301_Tti009149 [Triplophysa tibetana]
MMDTLVLSFQTQLSAVMETVLKTTMYEITRLVEESFLEQMDRGKREADVLRRRLILSEAKLRERERFKRVRCLDCGRTAVSKRRILNRGPETQSSLGQPLVIKQEKDSDSGWRCTKGSTLLNQETSSSVLDNKLNIAQVDVPKAGEVIEENTEIRDTEACVVIRSQIHNWTDSSSSETNGLSSSDTELRNLKNKTCVATCTERPGVEDEVTQRNQSKWLVSKPGSTRRTSVPQPDLVRVSPSSDAQVSRLQLASLDSGPIKQEVVVMLPSDWEEMERIPPQIVSKKAQLEVQRGDLLTTQPQVEKQVQRSGPPVKVQCLAPQAMQHLQPANQPCRSPFRKNTKMVLQPSADVSDQGAMPVDKVHPICKGLPTPKPPHVRQYPDGAGVGERSFSTINPGRSLPQGVNLRVQGDTRHISQRAVHSCNQCGKGFSHLCHLRAHQQIHTGERQFCCTICGRSFTKLSNLKAHRRVHTGERPYICMDCGKRFTQKCNLKRHQRIHSDITNSNT